MADEVKFTDSTTDLSEGESTATLGEKAWYVVNTYSTHENKVKENLKRRVESMGLGDLIFRIIVAEQEVPVMKDGMPTEKTRMKNLYPGYVFVEMIMTDYAWYVVRNTPGVTGFVGSSGKGTKPFPVPRTLMIMSKLSMVHLKAPKVEFFLSTVIPKSLNSKPSSLVEPLKSKLTSLKSIRSKKLITNNKKDSASNGIFYF